MHRVVGQKGDEHHTVIRGRRALRRIVRAVDHHAQPAQLRVRFELRRGGQRAVAPIRRVVLRCVRRGIAHGRIRLDHGANCIERRARRVVHHRHDIGIEVGAPRIEKRHVVGEPRLELCANRRPDHKHPRDRHAHRRNVGVGRRVRVQIRIVIRCKHLHMKEGFSELLCKQMGVLDELDRVAVKAAHCDSKAKDLLQNDGRGDRPEAPRIAVEGHATVDLQFGVRDAKLFAVSADLFRGEARVAARPRRVILFVPRRAIGTFDAAARLYGASVVQCADRETPQHYDPKH